MCIIFFIQQEPRRSNPCAIFGCKCPSCTDPQTFLKLCKFVLFCVLIYWTSSRSIKFQLCNEADIKQFSHVQVLKCLLYGEGQNNRKALEYGLLDPKLGANKRDELCATCGLDYQLCIGHWGYFDLPVPIFHVGYSWHIVKILQSICKTCSRVLLPETHRDRYLSSCSNPNLEYIQKKQLRKAVHKLASRVHVCPYCLAINGFVTKGANLSYAVHDVYRYAKSKIDDHVNEYSSVILENPELSTLLHKGLEIIRPARALQLFSKIPESDLPLLMMPGGDSWTTHPKDLIVQRVPVAPSSIRPSVVSEVRSGTNEDDLTQMYQWILAQAATIEEDITEADQVACLDNLHAEFARMINSQQSGLPPVQDHKFMRGLLQRLSGKHGRFRGNLLGKRTNYTARTVISPDPNLRIDEVCVPDHCAKLLTFPARVTTFNLDFLRSLVLNGPNRYPGALFVSYKLRGEQKRQAEATGSSDVVKRFLASARAREDVARHLQPGDVVERHLVDGDIILFNRQPSLHRVSIQAFKAVVKPFRTFRFNPCCCNPFNADFDGDEMNVHLPQTEAARAEAKHLMLSLRNIVSPKNGEPLISPIQDLITATHLLTLKDVFFTRDQACQLASQIIAGNHLYQPIKLPKPAIMKPRRLWTGKQLFSLILSPHPSTGVKINIRQATKSIYSNRGEEMCPNDGFILIHNSQLLAGCADKKLLGGGSKASIFYSLLRNYGSETCADAMWRLARISLFYLAHRGFSIGLGEVMPSQELVKSKTKVIDVGFSTCDDYIHQYEKNTLKCNPGCSMEDTLESNLSQELSKIRDEAGAACKRQLHPSNSPLVMAQSGSKGSFLNISQMIACVGQQVIGGKRVPDVINGRSLIHFPRGSRTPEAKGFVGNSFYSGLTPSEFFFHAMSGREGLTDTAVKTADTGYMQRRLIKFLEDLTIAYDNTVRDSRGDIIQFCYGSDGLDPLEMEVETFPVDLNKELNNLRTNFPCPDEEALTPEQIDTALHAALGLEAFSFMGPAVKMEILSFFAKSVYPRLRVWHQFCLMDSVGQCDIGHPEDARLTQTQVRLFLTRIKEKYEKALIEPGSAVGALCGQSVGEPATQMTLKTFHFAGVASMNITQGVPRMREIVNAAAKIKTPLLTVTLTDPFSASLARQVKLAIEPTRLADISISLRQCLTPEDVYVSVKLDEKRMARRGITTARVASVIQSTKLRKVKLSRVTYSKNFVYVYPVDLNTLETVVKVLEDVVVKGIPGVARVVIQQDKDLEHRIYVEGAKLREVMCVPGVVPECTRSNNILEVEQVLGVEAARRVVIDELLAVMEGHGVEVNIRHVMLLADVMTNRGEVYGYQRTGMAKAKNSVLCLASFERTGDHLFEAAYHGQDDKVIGVTESIILGNPTRLGTGTFDLLSDRYPFDTVLCVVFCYHVCL
ncbi:DNA-directed RNA polymerase III subunit RPC1 [Clonorchis sinensis]|uniref:DNA-directed RNA polymerase subunit n=1 Tax=Clonorchis sinensis TaxID=79923 RepID=A0A3R7D657_CLOSI|nr:DNA-directed RNA polymerase III subunit RPC1 [Clonorchis sinensis]